MKHRGILTVLSGFSGSGKGTIMKELLSRHQGYALSVSATTRQPREGEVHGREYFFVSRERFQEMIRQGELLEYAQYVDNYYGTPRSYVLEQLEQGKDVILEIEIQGARKIRQQFPDALLVFVTPPSAQELLRRLSGRGTETEEVIRARMRRAVQESEGMEDYDCILVNDDLDACVSQLHSLIRSWHLRAENNGDFIRQMKEELNHLQEIQ